MSNIDSSRPSGSEPLVIMGFYTVENTLSVYHRPHLEVDSWKALVGRETAVVTKIGGDVVDENREIPYGELQRCQLLQ
jgi:hypothetical protein